MGASLIDKFTHLNQQQLSPILQYAVVIMLIGFGFSASTSLSAYLKEKHYQVTLLELERRDLDTVESEDVWASRLQLAKELQLQGQSDLWSGETKGIIGASLGQTLRLLVSKHEDVQDGQVTRNRRASINVNSDLDVGESGQTILRFDVNAWITRDRIDELFLDLSALSPALYLNELRVSYPSNNTASAVISFDGYVSANVDGQVP